MKKILWGLFSVFLCLAFVNPVGALIISDSYTWEEALGGNGHSYAVVSYKDKGWRDAKEHLQSTLGPGHTLATITSQKEQVYIDRVLSDFSGEYWVGGFQDAGQSKLAGWNWITGETFSYTNWAHGEANDYGRRNEQYLAVWSKYSTETWHWNDEGYFGNISGYIVETAPVPEPGTIVLMGLGLVGLAGLGRKRFRK